MSDEATPRERIAKAIRDRGVTEVADASGVHFTRLYAWLRKPALTFDGRSVGRLRSALPEVPPEVWLEVFAPVPEPEPAESNDAA